MNPKIPYWLSMHFLVSLYWALFWLINGLDKFLNRHHLGLFRWWGKDRSAQFSSYFERLSLPTDGIAPLLVVTGLFELVIGALFAWAMVQQQRFEAKANALGLGFWLAGITLIGFSVFDVLFGDRAELREHGLFLMLLWVSALLIQNSKRSA